VATDRSIDALYQRPLGEFTSARNELAKAAGAKGAAIKALEKPSAAAWAVNQLYWRERRAYDKLIRASERVRAAHAQRLKGKAADLATVEAQHSAAVKDAAEHVRALLAGAGDPATPATMKSVVDTLQALPGGSEPGRLTKALAPIGFGAFGALMKGAVSSKALADVVTLRRQSRRRTRLPRRRRAPQTPRPSDCATQTQIAKTNAALTAARANSRRPRRCARPPKQVSGRRRTAGTSPATCAPRAGARGRSGTRATERGPALECSA
jgi:hypothetical protein